VVMVVMVMAVVMVVVVAMVTVVVVVTFHRRLCPNFSQKSSQNNRIYCKVNPLYRAIDYLWTILLLKM